VKKALKILVGLFVLLLGAIQIDALADKLPVIQKHKHLDRPADLPVDASKTLEVVCDAPADVRALLSAACADCHSHATKWPWYSYVAPMKWFVVEHVVAGRKHINFATFGDEVSEDQGHILDECATEVAEGHMPLPSYVRFHSEADLSEADRKKLVDWFRAESQKRKG
jgi:hypothetical protein